MFKVATLYIMEGSGRQPVIDPSRGSHGRYNIYIYIYTPSISTSYRLTICFLVKKASKINKNLGDVRAKRRDMFVKQQMSKCIRKRLKQTIHKPQNSLEKRFVLCMFLTICFL